MPLSYDGKKIVPAPLINITKNYNQSGAGNKLGSTFNITLNGTLVPFKGSPSGNYNLNNIASAFWTLSGNPPDEEFEGNNEDFNHLLRKQEALRWLFSQDGKSLEWQPTNGQPVMKCNPRIDNINFQEGIWANRVDYTIDLITDRILIPVGPLNDEDEFNPKLIESASEDWSFEEILGRVGSGYTVTHTVTAKGTTGFDETGQIRDNKEAWQHAADFVNARALGVVDATIISGVLGTDITWLGGDYVKNVTVNEEDGNYTVVENFTLQPQNTFTVKQFSFAETPDAIEVNYNGTIFGIANGGRFSSPQAITNAQNAVPSNSQAAIDVSGVLGNLLGSNQLGEPSQKTIAVNQNDGTVVFGFQWFADEDATSVKTTEATINFNASNGQYTLSLDCNIEGKGPDSDTRLANAKSAILTDANALILAKDILNGQIPVSIDINDNPNTKGISINETQGSVSANWTWVSVDSEFGNFQIEVNTVFPADVFVELPIPGRTAGPIQQDMNTKTSQIVTVTLTSENNTSKPSSATVIATMDDAGGIEADWFLQDDQENFDVVNKNYRRRRTHVVRQ